MISLVTTTRNSRKEELIRFIGSLNAQVEKDFELILVAQDYDDVEKYLYQSEFRYKIIHSEKTSLSNARNIGLKYVTGEIVGFPDDDCWYADNTLKILKQIFDETNSDVVCVNVLDPEKKKEFLSRQPLRNQIEINSLNVTKYVVSAGVFCRNCKDIQFDDVFGVGAKWGSGEESELLLRLLKAKKRIVYYRKIYVYHKYQGGTITDEKYYSYGVGYGALVEKAIMSGQYGVLLDYYCTAFRAVCAALLYAIKKNKRYKGYLCKLRGMSKGRKEYKKTCRH